jgi:hypothetical protein
MFRRKKPTPTYDLAEIQSQFRNKRGSITGEAADGARAMGLAEKDIYRCIESLTEADLHKSMPATHPDAAKAGLWQDVYKPMYKSMQVYLKVQLNKFGRATLIQFKDKKKW